MQAGIPNLTESTLNPKGISVVLCKTNVHIQFNCVLLEEINAAVGHTRNLQLLYFLENRHHAHRTPAPAGCPSTNITCHYLTQSFLSSAGSRILNAVQATQRSNSEHKLTELTITCSTGHQDPEEDTCLKQNFKSSLKKTGIQTSGSRRQM